MLTSSLILLACAASAVVAFGLGWFVRQSTAKLREAELQRGIYSAKGSIPQLESTVKQRDQHIARLENQVLELRDQQTEQSAAIKAKDSEILSRTRDVRHLESEVQVLKDGGGMHGELLLPGDAEPSADDGELSEADKTRVAEIEKQYERLKQGLFRRDDQIAELEAQLKNPEGKAPTESLEQQVAELTDEITGLRSRLEDADASVVELQETLQVERGEKDMLATLAKKRSDAKREAASKLAEYDAKLPELEQAIETRDRTIEQRDASIRRYLEEVAENKNEKAGLETKIQTLGEQIEARQHALDEVDETIAGRDQRIEALNETLRETRTSLASTTKTLETRELAIVKQQKRLATARTHLDSATANVASLKQTVNDRDFKVSDLDQAIGRLQCDLDDKVSRIETLEFESNRIATRAKEERKRSNTHAKLAEVLKTNLEDRDGKISAMQSTLMGAKDAAAELATLGATMDAIIHDADRASNAWAPLGTAPTRPQHVVEATVEATEAADTPAVAPCLPRPPAIGLKPLRLVRRRKRPAPKRRPLRHIGMVIPHRMKVTKPLGPPRAVLRSHRSTVASAPLAAALQGAN